MARGRGALGGVAFALLLAVGPLAAQVDLGTDAQRAAGKEVYGRWCAQCHGEDGDGQGIAAAFLHPRPRDFTAAKYKVRSTPNGTLPTDRDLEDVIRRGLPGTGMPAFPDFSAAEVRGLIAYLKSFAPDFEDPAAYGEPYDFPRPPPFSDQSLEEGFAAYVENDCARCHGELGRGDGRSGPTLRDDGGYFIRPADLTMPWTFRAGGSREAIFKTLTTGFNGTPMPAFADALSAEQRWQIVDWIVAQAGGRTTPPYTDLLVAVAAAEEVDLAAGLEAVRERFAAAPPALFPVIGQVMEPGRSFFPSVVALEARALYDRDQVYFLLTWHDMGADVTGTNGPALAVPREEEATGLPAPAPPSETPAVQDIWGQPVAAPTGGGLWDQDAAALPAEESSPYSDAVAIQLPVELREGVAKPYFLFGDATYPVDLLFADLGRGGRALRFEGRGGASLVPAEGDPPRLLSGYDRGEWAVVLTQPRRGGPGFAEGTFVPIAFSVWDGFAHERGTKRGLTRWFHLYVQPRERPPVLGPMVKAGLTVLGLELLILGLVRLRRRGGAPETSRDTAPGEPVTADRQV